MEKWREVETWMDRGGEVEGGEVGMWRDGWRAGECREGDVERGEKIERQREMETWREKWRHMDKMERWRDGEMGRWRSGEMGKWGDGDVEVKCGDMETQGRGYGERWRQRDVGDGEVKKQRGGQVERWRDG